MSETEPEIIIPDKDSYRFNIIKDTREKEGSWQFKNARNVDLVIDHKLDTGDYSIQGLESLLSIERKRNINEFASNITQARFKNELDRLKEFKYKYIICEFGYQDVVNWPDSSKLPPEKKFHIRTSNKYVMRWISEIQVLYNIHLLFCFNTRIAEWSAINIMRRVYEQEQIK